MIKTRLSQIANTLEAKLIGTDCEVSKVAIDSRANCEDCLFVALRGPHYDAHDFLPQVIEQGVKAILVEKQVVLDIPQIIVKNSRKALGQLAAYNRSQMKAKFIAVTGSSGKTTVKEMIASILQNVGETFATRGNLNNDIGVPLTLLEMSDRHQYGVIELGANHAGEIAYTAAITQADVALINNVAAAHLQGFGDLQGVARAKGEIYAELSSNGIAVVNNDDDFVEFWKKQLTNKMITFSVKGDADVTATQIRLDENQCPEFDLHYKQQHIKIFLPLAGLHNVNNALAAAACCIGLGVPLTSIKKGLSQVPMVTGRLMTEILANGCRVIDDSYNANLDSMKAAISLLAKYSGRKVLVIGDMAELGEYGRQSHEIIGEFAREAGIDCLYSCGVLTQFSQTAFSSNQQINQDKHFTNQKDLIQKLKGEAKQGTTILVKGSRSAHMERVVLALTDDTTEQHQSKTASLLQKEEY